MAHSNASLLSSNDIFLDGCNKSYVVQCTMWNNPNAWFFRITAGCERLQLVVIAMMLTA
jgi:hypothetical protein